MVTYIQDGVRVDPYGRPVAVDEAEVQEAEEATEKAPKKPAKGKK